MSNDFNGLILKAARILVNWSQQELAERAGCSITTINEFEKEAGGHRDETRARILRVLQEAGIIFVPFKDGEGPGVLYASREARAAAQPPKPRKTFVRAVKPKLEPLDVNSHTSLPNEE